MIQYGIAAILLLMMVIGAGLTQSGSWVGASPEEDEGYVEIVSVSPPPKAAVTINSLEKENLRLLSSTADPNVRQDSAVAGAIAQSDFVETAATCDAKVRDILMCQAILPPER